MKLIEHYIYKEYPTESHVFDLSGLNWIYLGGALHGKFFRH